MKLDQDTWVAIADGEKVFLMRNVGTTVKPRLQVVHENAIDNPPARDQGSDRPGRRHDASRKMSGGVESWGSSSMEQTDFHRLAQEDFARETAARLRGWMSSEGIGKLVVVAPPRTLGVLRTAYADDLRAIIVAEIDKDLTNSPADKIEASLLAWGD